jgi:hypothetical protein
MSFEQGLQWMTWLLCWSLGLQCIEYLRTQHMTLPQGVWAWSVQQADIPQHHSALRSLLFQLYAPRWHATHLGLRLCVVLYMAAAGASLGAVLFLFVSTLLILIRWRGAFNGGSDFMSLVVLTGLLLEEVVKLWAGAEWAAKAGLWYVTIHAVSSYFVSGWVKLLRPEWRSGRAMTIFLNGGVYGPLPADSLLRHPRMAQWGSWAFTLWEGFSPLALLHPLLAWPFCAVAALFHGLVFWFFGLNRFFWAWMASFPAILACSGTLGQPF